MRTRATQVSEGMVSPPLFRHSVAHSPPHLPAPSPPSHRCYRAVLHHSARLLHDEAPKERQRHEASKAGRATHLQHSTSEGRCRAETHPHATMSRGRLTPCNSDKVAVGRAGPTWRIQTPSPLFNRMLPCLPECLP
ncbi:hypothetical protein E2C01_036614 [Portunus trituberculatus]|uniref:Uncharacterized protein n=1 Tax=Portunus trituberculatus TaxID=210409 RepID=A0A5B7F602_PORTR|nr:hypothetical protein [Portunus trituberculatus]